MATETRPQPIDYWRNHAYDLWLETQDVPIFKGYYVEDARNLERRHWDLRGCPATVISLEGHRGLEHVHVLEIPPGETIPPFKMALEEVVYVFEGQGLASVWAEGQPKISFEWQKHSLFRIPPNYHYQLSNARGDQPALTLHVSLLPLALGTNPSIDYFFNNPYVDLSQLYGEEGNFYSAAAQPVHLSGTGTFSSGARAEAYGADAPDARRRSPRCRGPTCDGTATSSPTSPSGTSSRSAAERAASPTGAASSSPGPRSARA